MVRKYSIHEPDSNEPIGFLYYNEETKEYKVECCFDAPKYSGPAELILMRQMNMQYLSKELSLGFVRERVVPSGRQNIDEILHDLEIPYYDEIFFIDKLRGRCVMDNCLIDRIE